MKQDKKLRELSIHFTQKQLKPFADPNLCNRHLVVQRRMRRDIIVAAVRNRIAQAPYVPAQMIVDGVKHRWAKGRLVRL